jgi:hypothetical protein
MRKLSKLFQAVEEFYRNAIQAYSMVKYSAESYVMPDDEDDEMTASGTVPTDTHGILKAAEDLSYEIDNEGLLNQLDGLIGAYKGFLGSLNVHSDDFSKDAEEAAEDAGNLTSDYIDTINTRWQRLGNNPYLQLSADSDQYTESFPPQRVLEIAQAIVNDVNNKLEAEAAQVGSTPEEMITAQKAADDYNQQQVDRRDPNLRVTGDKVKQQLDANRRYREKLLSIKKMGPNHPDYARFERFEATMKRQYENLINGPNRENVVKRFRDRKASQRQKDKTLYDLVLQIQKTNSPGEKSRLTDQLVKAEMKILERKGKNLDDPFVLNSPEIQFALKPENIIARYTTRTKNLVESDKEEAKKLKALKNAGNLKGLTIYLQQQIANFKGDIAKAVKKKLKNSPALQPYIKAIDDATASGDKATLDAAKKAEAAFVVQHLNENEAVKTAVTHLPAFYTFRDICNSLDTSDASAVSNAILTGEKLISTYGRAFQVPVAAVTKIVNYLKKETPKL